jgi:hypothetical protein
MDTLLKFCCPPGPDDRRQNYEETKHICCGHKMRSWEIYAQYVNVTACFWPNPNTSGECYCKRAWVMFPFWAPIGVPFMLVAVLILGLPSIIYFIFESLYLMLTGACCRKKFDHCWSIQMADDLDSMSRTYNPRLGVGSPYRMFPERRCHISDCCNGNVAIDLEAQQFKSGGTTEVTMVTSNTNSNSERGDEN